MADKKKIRITELIAKSYKVLAANAGLYVKLLYIPFLILLVLGIGILFIDSPQIRPFAATVYGWLVPLTMIPVVTSWHRFILIGPDKEGVQIGYQFHAREWLYFKALIVLVIAVLVGHFFLAVLLGPIFVAGLGKLVGENLGIGLSRLILSIIIFLIVCRFLLVLPSAALGKKMDIAKSSLAMQGNVLRLTAAYFLALLAPWVVLIFTGSPASLLLGGLDPNMPVTLSLFVISLIVEMAFYVLSVGVLSYAYKALVLK